MLRVGLTPRRFLTAGILLEFAMASAGQRVFSLQAAQQLSQSNDKQDSQDKKDANKPAQKKEPAPLFGGKLGIKSSSNSKETAAMGFNGIDPSGKVDAKMLATTPTAANEAQAKQLSTLTPSAAELTAFLQEGGLKAK